ncbi:MAG: hypothetical protein H0T63_05245, partial [Pyrinomonadaceae bacterium]|nr:hypothetical protein [Pyrinomonadaceae bacterium]
MAEITYPTVMVHDLERLLKLVHPDPHSALGAHPTPLGVIVRTYKPDARTVEVIIEGEPPRSMMSSHPAGLFELVLEDRLQTFA